MIVRIGAAFDARILKGYESELWRRPGISKTNLLITESMKELVLTASLYMLCLYLPAQTIIFSEEFDGEIPATWEIGPGDPVGAVWQWSSDGTASSVTIDGNVIPTRFWGTLPPIASPTVNNGVAMFNSDAYDNGGGEVGSGPFPGDHISSLTSPSVDCSAFSSVALKFNQFARGNANTTSTFVEVSSDGGQTWTDFPINEDVVSNDLTPPDDVLILDISSVAGGQSDVKVRFTWNGRYYYWLIDDVQLIETPSNNLALGDIFYPPASYAQPQSQIDTDTMGFFADISNLGRNDIPNVVLKATVIDSNDTELFVDSTILDVLPSLYEDSTVVVPNIFVPNNLDRGVYAITYEVYSLDSLNDFDPSDNFKGELFQVAEITFSKDDGRNFGGTRPASGADYEVGNLYIMSPNAGDDFFATKAFFAVDKNVTSDGPLEGEQVTVFLYKVLDEVLPDFSNFSRTDDSSLEIVGFASYTFQESDIDFNLVEVDLLDAFTTEPGVTLEAGTRYFLTAKYEGSSATIFHGSDSDIDYFQISTVAKTDRWSLGGFGPSEACVLRMQISAPVDVEENSLPQSALKVYPNPANDVLTADLSFERATDALVLIADMTGKILMMREVESVTENRQEFDLTPYPAGMYFIRVSTTEGASTRKFMVNH